MCSVLHVLRNRGALEVSDLLGLIGERRWRSSGGVLSERRGAGSVGEVCEPRLTGESLAPYENEAKQTNVTSSQRIKNRACERTRVGRRGNKELPAVRHSFVRGGGTLRMDSLGFALFLEILFWVTSLLRTDDLFHCAQKRLCTVRVHAPNVRDFKGPVPPKKNPMFPGLMKFKTKQLIVFITREP